MIPTSTSTSKRQLPTSSSSTLNPSSTAKRPRTFSPNSSETELLFAASSHSITQTTRIAPSSTALGSADHVLHSASSSISTNTPLSFYSVEYVKISSGSSLELDYITEDSRVELTGFRFKNHLGIFKLQIFFKKETNGLNQIIQLFKDKNLHNYVNSCERYIIFRVTNDMQLELSKAMTIVNNFGKLDKNTRETIENFLGIQIGLLHDVRDGIINLEEAIKKATEAQAHEDFNLLLQLAVHFERQKDYQKVVKCYKAISRENPHFIRAKYTIALTGKEILLSNKEIRSIFKTKDGNGFRTFVNGDIYVGALEQGCGHGNGLRIFANGDIYVGAWERGFMHGNGTYFYANGDTYIGTFQKGVLKVGMEVRVNGDISEGTFPAASNPHSYIRTIVKADGTKYIGQWEYNKIIGTWIQTDGTQHKGEFLCFSPYGYGVKSDKDGNMIQKGFWFNGDFNPNNTLSKPDNFDEIMEAVDIKISEVNSLCITAKNEAKYAYSQIENTYNTIIAQKHILDFNETFNLEEILPNDIWCQLIGPFCVEPLFSLKQKERHNKLFDSLLQYSVPKEINSAST